MPSEQTSEQPPRTTGKKRSPLEFLIVFIIAALVVAGAFYQEEIAGIVRLHAWDRGAPGRAVVEFLEAGKKGNRAQADAYIGNPAYQPLVKNNAWLGYSTTVQEAKVLFLFDELIPTAPLQPTSTEFNFIGSGGAEVIVPNKQGKPVSYSLVRLGNRWKIINIRGGRMEQNPVSG